jgi:hypothetical protein
MTNQSVNRGCGKGKYYTCKNYLVPIFASFTVLYFVFAFGVDSKKTSCEHAHSYARPNYVDYDAGMINCRSVFYCGLEKPSHRNPIVLVGDTAREKIISENVQSLNRLRSTAKRILAQSRVCSFVDDSLYLINEDLRI